jgi:hypothetical protein
MKELQSPRVLSARCAWNGMERRELQIPPFARNDIPIEFKRQKLRGRFPRPLVCFLLLL